MGRQLPKPSHSVQDAIQQHIEATTQAIYAGRPFRWLPRETPSNQMKDIEDDVGRE